MDIFFFASGQYMLNELVNRDSDTFYVLSLSASSALIRFLKRNKIVMTKCMKRNHQNRYLTKEGISGSFAFSKEVSNLI
jgi:hypothetical protein